MNKKPEKKTTISLAKCTWAKCDRKTRAPKGAKFRRIVMCPEHRAEYRRVRVRAAVKRWRLRQRKARK